MKRSPNNKKGYVLLPVVIAITLVAVIAFLSSRESGMAVNIAANELESQQLDYLTQAAMQHALRDANQGACNAYALPSTAFGAHSYQASFTPDSGSPVAVTAVGTLQNGATRSLTRDTVRLYQTVINQTYQPGASEGKDTSVQGGPQADRNYGATTTLWVDSEAPYYTLFEFDLSDIPASAYIVDAKLELYAEAIDDVTSADVGAYRVTRSWVEGSGDNNGLTPADGANFNTYDGINSWGLTRR